MRFDEGDVPIFRSEHSLFELLIGNRKPWDARIWDLSDDRIYTLAFFSNVDHKPLSPYVGFVDKETDQVAVYEYRAMEFADYALGWCFIILGLQQYLTAAPVEKKTVDMPLT